MHFAINFLEDPMLPNKLGEPMVPKERKENINEKSHLENEITNRRKINSVWFFIDFRVKRTETRTKAGPRTDHYCVEQKKNHKDNF